MLKQAKSKKEKIYKAFASTKIINEDNKLVYTVKAITDSQLYLEKDLIFRVQWLEYSDKDIWELVKQISHLKRLINRFYEVNSIKSKAEDLKLQNWCLSSNSDWVLNR